MSRRDFDLVRRSYRRLNEAYRTGEFLPLIEEVCSPDVVLRPTGFFPDSRESRGHEGMLRFTANQAEAFEDLSVDPVEIVEAAGHILIPVRMRGRARHTGLEIEFAFVHVWTLRQGKLARLEMYATKSEALEAVRKQPIPDTARQGLHPPRAPGAR